MILAHFITLSLPCGPFDFLAGNFLLGPHVAERPTISDDHKYVPEINETEKKKKLSEDLRDLCPSPVLSEDLFNTSPTVDLSSSEYFNNHKSMVKDINLTKIKIKNVSRQEGLPKNWLVYVSKYKKTGRRVTAYISPDRRLVRGKLAVLEYMVASNNYEDKEIQAAADHLGVVSPVLSAMSPPSLRIATVEECESPAPTQQPPVATTSKRPPHNHYYKGCEKYYKKRKNRKSSSLQKLCRLIRNSDKLPASKPDHSLSPQSPSAYDVDTPLTDRLVHSTVLKY